MNSDRSKRKAGRISNVVCPNCKQSLDDVIESLIRQRGKFKGQREQARGERDKARAEVERLREALNLAGAELTGLDNARLDRWERQCYDATHAAIARGFAKPGALDEEKADR